MADPQKPNTPTHPLVTKLMGDSDTPPKLVTLIGYFGPSKKADSIRLYTSLDFQSYFEIPKAAIVTTTPADAKDEHSPTVVHVKAGTPVDAVQTSTKPVESYLQGSIAALDLNPQPLPPGVVRPTPTATFVTVCGVSHPPCSGVHTQCCPISAPPCSGVQTQCCAISAPPCSGVHTQCCPISAPPCSGVQTQCCGGLGGGIHPTPTITIAPCCPITHPPCSGVQTHCCPVQGTAATVCTQVGCVHPTTTVLPTHCTLACPQPQAGAQAIVHPTTTVIPTHEFVCFPSRGIACSVIGCPTQICTQAGCLTHVVPCNFTQNPAICFPSIIGVHCPSQHPVGCPAITHNC
jgi:hypothetical protein